MLGVASSRVLIGALAAATLGSLVAAPADAARLSVGAPLSYGSRGAVVTNVQRIIVAPTTGVYDRSTMAAIRRIQVWKGISPADGKVGAATWAALSDPTLTRRMKTRPTARRTMTLTTWLSSVHGYGIAYRESKFTCSAVSPSGSWRGKWQMSATLWKTFGGTKFARSADRATCAQQDQVAFRVWQAAGWSPWNG